ncbi:MAG: hypothetical protein ACOYNF_03425 [Rhodoferax sp.]
MTRTDNTDPEPDIVLAILSMMASLTPDLTPEISNQIEQAIKDSYGGQRFRIAKTKKHPTPEQRQKIIHDALAPELASTPTDRIAESNGIHRATLYRYLKRRGQ